MFGRARRAARRAVKAGDMGALIASLADPDPDVRADTANACMEIAPGSASPDLVDALLRAALEPAAQVRGQAILALGSIRAPQARDIFLRALSDQDWLVRSFAANVIGWMPDPRAVGPLQRLLVDQEDALVRSAAAYTLGEIGDRSAITALQAQREAERDRDVRSAIDEALAKLTP